MEKKKSVNNFITNRSIWKTSIGFFFKLSDLLDLLYKYHAPKSVRSIRMPKKNPMFVVNIPNPFCQHRTQARLPAAPHRGPLGSCVKPDLSDWESQTDSEHSPQGCFIWTVLSFSSFF